MPLSVNLKQVCTMKMGVEGKKCCWYLEGMQFVSATEMWHLTECAIYHERAVVFEKVPICSKQRVAKKERQIIMDHFL